MKSEITTSTPTTQQPSEFFRGIKALADWMGVSEVSVRRAVRRHELPVTRFGGCLLFRRSDVEKTLNKLTIPSVSMEKARKGA